MKYKYLAAWGFSIFVITVIAFSTFSSIKEGEQESYSLPKLEKKK